MSWEPRPVPDVNPETAAYWEAAADGRLLLGECEDCGLVFHYPRAHCPDCFGDDVEWREASGTGTVYTYSVAERMTGWPENDLPLIVAYVELTEGPRMMTNVVGCEPSAVEVGTPVEVQFVPTADDDVAIPVFSPQ